MENSTKSHKMQPMTAKEAAASILAHIYGHVDAFRASPPRKAEQFAAAGLMRCCALLQGILVLDERMPVLAGILVRQHWETWLVSLYVLLDGDEALEVIVADNIYRMQRMRPIFEALRLEVDHHYDPDPDTLEDARLRGRPGLRLRVGPWRVIFERDEEARVGAWSLSLRAPLRHEPRPSGRKIPSYLGKLIPRLPRDRPVRARFARTRPAADTPAPSANVSGCRRDRETARRAVSVTKQP